MMIRKILFSFSVLILGSVNSFAQNFIGLNNHFYFDFEKYQKHIYYSPGFLYEKKFNKIFSLLTGFQIFVYNYKYHCNDCPRFPDLNQQNREIGVYDSKDRYVYLIVPVSTRFYFKKNQHRKLKPYLGLGLEVQFNVYEKHTGSYFKINGNVFDPGPYYSAIVKALTSQVTMV